MAQACRAGVAGCLTAVVAWGFAGAQQQERPDRTDGAARLDEYLLIGDAVRGAGEPVIAINPKDPNNIIVGAMANRHFVEGSPFGSSRKPVGPDTILAYRNTKEASISRYAISNDRGKTWRFIEDPFREYFKMNGTADAFVGAGPDGTLFIGAMAFFPRDASPEILAQEHEPEPGLLFGAADLTWSNDKGATWHQPPVSVMGLDTPLDQYGPGLKPVIKLTTPYDRPYLVSDLSTGTIYVPGTGLAGDPPRRETFIRASKDKGSTWGPIYAIDSPDYPQAAFGAGRPSAAGGVLGVTYIAGSAPADTGATCPCLVFGASADEGKSFERHIVRARFPPLRGFDEEVGPPSLPMIAADPSHPGRFAIMILAVNEAEMRVFVTDDYGKRWSGAVLAGRTPRATLTKPDISFSSRGDLAVMWLAVHRDRSYEAWSAVSRDGARHFSRPLRVSSGPSPPRSAIESRGNNWDGDDLSSLAVDDDFVHIVWADGRAGFLGAWYAQVPLSSFRP